MATATFPRLARPKRQKADDEYSVYLVPRSIILTGKPAERLESIDECQGFLEAWENLERLARRHAQWRGDD